MLDIIFIIVFIWLCVAFGPVAAIVSVILFNVGLMLLAALAKALG